MKEKNYDFGGYATRNNLKCADGRVIRKGAFKECDGAKVPLVWQHSYSDPADILGFAVLEHRDDGTYCYGSFNETVAGQNAKELVKHGDITRLSIFANKLKQQGADVLHGMIKEVSLVLSGANPGAYIDDVSFAHDDSTTPIEAIIFGGEEFKVLSVTDIKHADDTNEEDVEETVEEVFDTLTDKQKAAVYAVMETLVAEDEEEYEEEDEDEEEAAHSENLFSVDDVLKHWDDFDKENQEEITALLLKHGITCPAIKENKEQGDDMKHNVFDKTKSEEGATLSHADFGTIMEDAKRRNSFKEAAQDWLAHAGVEYGFTNVEYLFPDARVVDGLQTYGRDVAWVTNVINSTKHSPFSQIKSVVADITAKEARAKGYVKGNQKDDEIVVLLKRETGPGWIYKRQKLDREDMIKIQAGGYDIIPWLNAEMRVQIEEELARAILIGDGRLASDPDKVKEDKIRPIFKDDDFYAYHVAIPVGSTGQATMDAIVRARKFYKGSGNPTYYTSQDTLADMLLIKDGVQRPMYPTIEQLKTALRVKDIIEVPVFDEEPGLIGILVNLTDYNIGTDRGGELTRFEDFDIDFNQQKILLETYLSGALVKPRSALVFQSAEPVPAITISTQPADDSVVAGSITESLTVAATATESAVLTYQWYSSLTDTNVGGTLIPLATTASFAIPTDLVAGTYYYYCVVAATGAESVTSAPATVTVTAAPTGE